MMVSVTVSCIRHPVVGLFLVRVVAVAALPIWRRDLEHPHVSQWLQMEEATLQSIPFHEHLRFVPVSCESHPCLEYLDAFLGMETCG